MTQSLAQLQASWRLLARNAEWPYATKTFNLCADALQPHVEREAKYEAVVKAAQMRIKKEAHWRACDALLYMKDKPCDCGYDALMSALAALSSEEK